MKWIPVLKNNNAKPVFEKLDEISNIIINSPQNPDDEIGLISGKFGRALFLFYYAKLMNEQKYYDFGFELISSVFNEINNGFNNPTFSTGLSGIGWAIEHLVQNDYIEANTDDTLEALDPYLSECMINEIKTGNYDFFHGAIGIAVYFLSRLKKKHTKTSLLKFIDELRKLSSTDENGGLKWKDSVSFKDKNKIYINFGLAHGLPSIIVFLSQFYQYEPQNEKVIQLLNGSIKYLMKYRQDSHKYISCFPNWITDPYIPSQSRLAWCYGDLGVGISLWQAFQGTGNEDWKKIAIDLLLASTKRKDLHENFVRDAGICHGTASIAHIYNRIFQCTGINEFKLSAIYWINETIKMAKFESRYAGYKIWSSEGESRWSDETGLLTGISGIGLMFISAISDIEPTWDRCLLMS